ncbi:MAG: hypothetical protein V3S39_10450 [Thermodesulfobacteriota bacterium]
MKGKKIGVNNYAGNFDLYLRYMLSKHGLNPKKDTAILEMPIPAVIKSLLAKDRPLAKAFIAGYLEAIKETKRDLESTLADWSAFADIGLIKRSPTLPYLLDDGKIDLELLKTDMGLLQQFGYVKAIPRLEDIIDHSLIDEVLAGR